MTTPILLSKLGTTVETCIIETWHKQVGDSIEVGDILCDVETDKTTLEVESTASGTILALHFDEGDEVEVLATIATIGESHEAAGQPAQRVADSPHIRISPRVQKLATQQNIAYADINGTGPNGRIIERDIQAKVALGGQAVAMHSPEMTPVAKRMVESGEFNAPEQGSGPKGRVMRRDLGEAVDQILSPGIEKNTDDDEVSRTGKGLATRTEGNANGEGVRRLPQGNSVVSAGVKVLPVKGARRVIAQRMLNSAQTTAPFTLHRYADARMLRQYRQRLKSSLPELGMNSITLNDLVLFATVRTLGQHSDLNVHFLSTEIHQFGYVDLGFADALDEALLNVHATVGEVGPMWAAESEGYSGDFSATD